MKDRSFKVTSVKKKDGTSIKFKHGRYISSTPMGAVKKAFTKLCNSRSKRILKITIQETTAQSDGKEFTYQLERTKLKTPIVRFAGTDKEFKIRYSVRCTSLSSTKQVARSSTVTNQEKSAQKGGSSGLYEISRTQYLVVSSLEEICNRLKLRRRKLLRTKVRGKVRIVGKTTKRLRQIKMEKRLEKERQMIRSRRLDNTKNSKSFVGQKAIQIAAGGTKRKRARVDALFEWIMNQTSLAYLHRNTGPKVFHDAKMLYNLSDGETKSNTEETNKSSKLRLIYAFLSFCDSMHDFNDTRSLIKYHLNIPHNPQVVHGFLFCRDKIQTVQNFSRSASILLLRNHFETMLFNYMYDKYPMLVEDTSDVQHEEKFHYYCTNESHDRIKRLFKNHGKAVQFDQLFDPFNLYARDIAAVKNTVMQNIKSKKEWKRIINMMHYWDAMKSSVLTHTTGSETFSFLDTFPNRITDPRHSKFCIKNKQFDRTYKTEKNVTLDIGCDNNDQNDVHIENQKSSPVNTVSNISYIIGLIQKHGLQTVFGKKRLTFLESELAFYPISTLEEVSDFYIEKIIEREKRYAQLYDPKTSLGQLFKNLRDVYTESSENVYNQNMDKKSLKNKYISLLLDMKRTGDWGQASWVYNNNKIHEKSKKNIVVFESGDKLSALYSIYLNNPTIFGGGIGNVTNSSFGFYNPYYTHKGGMCGVTKGGGHDEVIDLLNPYARVSDTAEFFISNVQALKDFLDKNIVSFQEVAKQIFESSGKTLPNEIAEKLQTAETISEKNKRVYDVCQEWLQPLDERVPKISLEMFELTNFIELTMNSILSMNIENKLASFLNGEKASFIGWFAAIYPNKFYYLRKDQNVEILFYKKEVKLVELWVNTYQHMYSSEIYDENIFPPAVGPSPVLKQKLQKILRNGNGSNRTLEEIQILMQASK